MSKLIALAAVVGAVLLPGAAHAATAPKISGVVVSKETARHTLIVASPHGKVTTVRVTAHDFRSMSRGSRVAATGTKLADGSLHATLVKRSGATKHARIRVTVLKVNGKNLLVAGGGSAFTVHLTRATRVHGAARSDVESGDKIETEVELSHGDLVGDDVQTVGDATLIDFSGKVTALDAASLTLADDGASTVIAIPDGVTLPPLVQVGSEVEVIASVSGTTLTLVEIKIDGDGAETGDDDGSSVGDDSSVRAQGFVTALDSTSITIQPGDSASPVTFAIPDGFTLPDGLAAGSRVEARGEVVSSVLTLTKLKLKSDGSGDDADEVETEGTVTALDSGSITIQPARDGTPLTFTIPDGFTLPDGLKVGSLVEAKGTTVNSVLTLSKIKLEDEGDGDGGGDGGADG
jgi:hypothetical protein